MAVTNSVVALLIGGFVIFLLKSIVFHKSRGRYPPGPKPKFLIGNLFDLPETQAAQKYLEWGRQYNSDILHISVLGKHIVVLNKLKIAEELLEKRARLYSGRVDLPSLKALEWEFNFAFIDYGPEWRSRRRISQQHFNRQASTMFQPIELRRVRKTLFGLLHSPEKLDVHNRILSVSIPLDMLYGYDVLSLDDPVVKASTESVEIGSPLLMPRGSMMNVFPALRHVPPWVPGAFSQRKAAKAAGLAREMKRIPLEDLKQRMANGQASYSLLGNFLEKKSSTGASQDEENVLNDIAYTIYGGASDTTISATGSFFYLMAIYPEVQRKAQAEIDGLLGAQRLPEFSDRPSLPYIEAIYRELLRWCPPAPLGISHLLSEDDFVRDYFLPKGSVVFANIWAMTHDPEVYKDPHEFKPERFFDENGELNNDDRVLAYGFGRRICVGKYIASSTMWILIVSVLACFRIDKAKDESGNEVEIDDKYVDAGVVCQKTPFKCSIVPRSEFWRSLIEEAVSEARL